jgi:hypothetical protein
LQPAAPARRDELCGLHSVAGLGVDRHRHVDAPCDQRRRGEHLVGRRTLVILVAQRGGHAGAGGRDHGEPGGDDGSRGRCVPRVREQKRVPGAM